MTQKEKQLFLKLCDFVSPDKYKIRKLIEKGAVTPELLGCLFANRMAGVACGVLERRELLSISNSILEGSDGHDIVLQKYDTIYLLDNEPFSDNNGRSWYRILYNGSEGYVVAGNNSPKFTFETERGALVDESGGTMDDNIYVSTLIPSSGNYELSQNEMENNAMIIYDYLSKQGWSKNAICGAIANMQAESTINPGLWKKRNTTNPGYGLVQWTPATKWTDYADSHGYNHSELNRQLEYLIYSMQPGRGEWLVGGVTPRYQLHASEYISSTRSAYDLAIVFLLCYERPLDQSDSVKSYRGSLANSWLSFFNSLGW